MEKRLLDQIVYPYAMPKSNILTLNYMMDIKNLKISNSQFDKIAAILSQFN